MSFVHGAVDADRLGLTERKEVFTALVLYL